MEEMLSQVLSAGLQEIGIDTAFTEKFLAYGEAVLKANQSFNLLGNVEPREFVVKHILDSLAGIAAIDSAKTVLDMGTGAGLPGFPLAICLPDVQFTLVDATEKKVHFLSETAEMLGVQNLRAIAGRAEELGRGTMREYFDLCVSRAMAPMEKLAEYCLPLVKVGGRLVAYKGPKAKEELEAAKTAVQALGGGESSVRAVNVPFLEGERNLIVIAKTRQTPGKYPRTNAQIKNKPIR